MHINAQFNERGFNLLTSSLRDNSDVFGWMRQEFLS